MGVRSGVLVLALVAPACTAEAVHGLDGRDADEAVAALTLAGVPASHRATADRGEVVEVPSGEEGYAASVLRAEGVPRRAQTGFAGLGASSGLVPSPAEDDARWLAALGGEVARHLLHLDGVADASVVVTRPRVDPIVGTAAAARPTASVLVVVKAAATPIWREADVQRLVAAAIAGQPDDVTVVLAHAPAAPPPQPLLSTLGPLTVTRASRPLLVGILTVAALVLLALGVLLVVVERRRASERARRQRAEETSGIPAPSSKV